jgi:hypothetical protein
MTPGRQGRVKYSLVEREADTENGGRGLPFDESLPVASRKQSMPSLQQVLQALLGPSFHIDRELAGGGMSRVFLAREPALNRDVVVKVLPPDLVSRSSLQRFTREIQVTARLQHPYILPVITAGGNDELRYYIAPFIRGESLRARLASPEPMPLADVVRVGDQLLQAVAFAHARGVIHRDIKPGNVLLSEGHAILADFGIAGLAKDEPSAEQVDVTGSTLETGRVYIAPERPQDEARDLFATAVLIHEMATGRPGTADATAASVSAAIRARHPGAPAREVRGLASVLCRSLAADPAARHATAAELRGAMHSLAGAPRRTLVAGISVGVVAAALALAMFAARKPDEVPAPRLPHAVSDTVQPAPLQHAPAPRDQAPAAQVAAPPAAPERKVPEAVTQLRAAVAAGMTNSPADNEASQAAALRALRDSVMLDAHDREVARGYLALARRNYPEACAAFERARASRPSFDAWFGTGECNSRDDAIVLDAQGAPAFRASYQAAFAAYVNATRAMPNAPAIAYRRMATVVPQNSGDIRVGRTADNRTFVAHWRVVNDTFAFAFAPGGTPRQLSPETLNDAADAARVGRERLRPPFLAWVRQSPAEPMAHEMLALLLENMGAVAQAGDDHVSALSEIALARSLATNSPDGLRLATSQARLMLRAHEHDALASLVDSLVAAHPQPTPAEAEQLMPFALLTGRIRLASSLLTMVSGTTSRAIRGADGRPVALPPGVVAERADFAVRATLGVCDERVKSGPKRMVELLDAAFPSGVPRGVESAFMERIIVLALPCVGPGVMTVVREPGRMLQSWAPAFDPRDTVFPAVFAARSRGRALASAPEPGMDGVVVDALARLAQKDSAGALRALTLGLDRMPFIHRGVFTGEWVIGATARGMAMAGELADALGETQTARRWAPAIAALWKNADPELQPVAERLRAIAIRTDESGRE